MTLEIPFLFVAFLFSAAGGAEVMVKLLQDVQLANVTATSVTIVWPADLVAENMTGVRLIVRLTNSEDGTFTSRECPMLRTRCHFKALAPDTEYGVVVFLDRRIATSDGWGSFQSPKFSFKTPNRAKEEHDELWWLLYMALPVVGAVLVVVVVVTILLAMCCGWGCWRRKEHRRDISSPNDVPSNAQRDNTDATEQWVKETFRAIEDETTHQYNKPVWAANSSTQANSASSTQAKYGGAYSTGSMAASNHSYLELVETPLPRTTTNVSKESRGTSPSAFPCPMSAGIAPRSLDVTRLPSSPHLTSPPGSPRRNEVQSSVHAPLTTPTPPGTRGNDVLYTNTEDLSRLLGTARKMFRHL